MLRESTGTDAWGHGCVWYYNELRKGNSKVCKLKGLADMCPLACESKQQCYSPKEVYTERRVWDKVVLISSMLKSGLGTRQHNGTLCLAKHLNEQEVYRKCLEWHATGGKGSKGGRGVSAAHDKEIEEFLVNMNTARLHPRINVTDCEELRESIDTHCQFDGEQVAAFTRDARQHDGNYTIAFWIRPHGEEALNKDGRFHPTMTFWSSLSPPKHLLSMGLWYVIVGPLTQLNGTLTKHAHHCHIT